VIKSIFLNRKALIFGGSFAGILIIVKTLEFFFFQYKFALETYLGAIAIIFLILGIYFGSKLGNKKTTVAETPVNSVSINSNTETDLSPRELEVLLNIAEGMTNQQIADKLFVSLSTVKTHTANIYSKLGVKSRTQALSKAKALNIIR
jgi:DNA-binding CsgD family transcriptional regulator